MVLTAGSPPASEPSASYDRFVSSFVLDLLSEDDIAAVLQEAHRMLVEGGLLCLTSLSIGDGVGSRLISKLWAGIHTLHPALVGGCRPLELAAWLPESSWRVRHRARLAPFGVPSEAVVAERRERD